jgi:hypothetical protein
MEKIVNIDPNRLLHIRARTQLELGAQIERAVHMDRHRLNPCVVRRAWVVDVARVNYEVTAERACERARPNACVSEAEL